MEDFKEKYEYNCVKEYVNQGVEYYKALKEKGLTISNALDLNESNGSKIVLLGDNVFSVKLDDSKLDFEVSSYIYDVYKDKKGNFYTRMSKKNDDLGFENKILYDAIIFHNAIQLKEVVK